MEQDLFSHLPSEIIIGIFSRLSVQAVALSKCVCKAWLDLLESDYFVDSNHSKSAALAVLVPYADQNTHWCKVFEIEDGVDDLESNNPIAKFDLPLRASAIAIGGSANGLLFLHNYGATDFFFIYNPITREYIMLGIHDDDVESVFAYGFGGSRVSGEHKVVGMNPKSDHCRVYTIGTGRWRRVETSGTASFNFDGINSIGAFVNGNLHWKVSVSDPEYQPLIACFDLETERFSTFLPPPFRGSEPNTELFTLRDCLCFSDKADDGGIEVWLMKECGVEKSWRKEYEFKRHPNFRFDQLFQPIKVFKNGDILVLCDWKMFFCYSTKTKTYQKIQFLGAVKRWKHSFIDSLLFTPSFRSLRRFGMEDVISF